MKLYEINEEIRRLLWLLEPDPETGEIPMNADELEERIHALSMERDDILQYLAKVVLNLRAEETALKNEETRLRDRRQGLERREERIMAVLDRECAGQNTDLGIAVFRYRASTRTDVTDAGKAVRWLKRHKYGDCIRVHDPEVDKNSVRTLIKSGIKIPGIVLTQDRICSLK